MCGICFQQAGLTHIIDEANDMHVLEVERILVVLRHLDCDVASHVHNVVSSAEDEEEESANMVIGNVKVQSVHEPPEAELANAVASWRNNIKASSDAGAMACSARPVAPWCSSGSPWAATRGIGCRTCAW